MSESSWFPTPEEVRARRAEREAEDAARVAGVVPPPLPIPPLHSAENPFRKTTGLSLLIWVFLGLFATVGFMILFGLGHPERRGFKELMPFAQFTFYGVLLAWVLSKSRQHGPDLDRVYGQLPEWSEISGLGGLLFTLILFSMGTATMMASFITGLWDRPSTQVTDPSAPLFITFLLVVVLAPILEELVFRGILFQRWSLRWGMRKAAILNGCAFGLLHVNFLGAGVMGFAACLLFARSRKLLVPTALHMSNNLIPFLLMAMVGEEGAGSGASAAADAAATPGPAALAVCSGVLLLISIPYLAKFIREHWPAKGQPPPYFQRA